MTKELTNSRIDRQNILNNTYAIKRIDEELELKGYCWKKENWFTKSDVAKIFDVDIRTITNYLNSNEEELTTNGYIVLKGKNLKEFKESFGKEIDFPTKTTTVGLLSFRSVLNLAMLLSESEKAKEIRSRILDIAIDVMTEKTGGQTKYINQRDSEYLINIIKEETERQKFTNALNKYVDMGPYKYAYFTNKIYECIFLENAKEYRNILRLQKNDKTRDTMYSEALLMIASFEAGIAYELEKESTNLDKKLSKVEVDTMFEEYFSHPMHKPLIDNVRTKMSSRDLNFRDAFHSKLESYISSVSKEDYEKFLGEASKSLEHQIEEHRDVLLRMKDK